MRLTLEKASLIVDQALVKARQSKFRPMCVAVLDKGGHIKRSNEKMERAFYDHRSLLVRPGVQSA